MMPAATNRSLPSRRKGDGSGTRRNVPEPGISVLLNMRPLVQLKIFRELFRGPQRWPRVDKLVNCNCVARLP